MLCCVLEWPDPSHTEYRYIRYNSGCQMNKLTCIKTKISRSRNGWSLGRFVAENKRLFSFDLLGVCFSYNSVGFTLTKGGESVWYTLLPGQACKYSIAWPPPSCSRYWTLVRWTLVLGQVFSKLELKINPLS